MGSDNLPALHRWKNYETILKDYEIYVYPRPEFPLINISGKQLIELDAPLINISATQIRELIESKQTLKNLVPDAVIDYLESGAVK